MEREKFAINLPVIFRTKKHLASLMRTYGKKDDCP